MAEKRLRDFLETMGITEEKRVAAIIDLCLEWRKRATALGIYDLSDDAIVFCTMIYDLTTKGKKANNG